MSKEPDKMQEGHSFQYILQRYEEMLFYNKSYFFDVEDFEEIIDYYLDIRDFNNASVAAEKAESQHPGSWEIKIKKVHIYLESGKPALALDELNSFSDFERDDYEFFLLKGTALAQLGSFKQAEKIFDEVLENELEEKIDILVNISIAFENSSQYKHALKYLKMAWEIEPENLNVLYDLAYYYEKLNDYSASIDFYNKYLDLDPFSENVWYNLGVIYFKNNDTEKAVECYDYAIAINPGYASAYFNKANLYATENNYIQAIRIYNEFLELEPENLLGWCFLGECFEETGNYERSLEIYKKVIEIDNTYADGWFGAGISLMNMDRHKDAATYVLKAIDFDRENPEYWFTLGEINEKLRLPGEAIKCYRYVCQMDSLDREAWIRLAHLLIESSQIADALVVLREAYQHNFNSQDILYMLSAVYFRLEDEYAGTRFLEKAISQGRGGARLFFEVYPEGKLNERIKTLLHKDL
jgi:tetratricopeptide (TPR) repeat protein